MHWRNTVDLRVFWRCWDRIIIKKNLLKCVLRPLSHRCEWQAHYLLQHYHIGSICSYHLDFYQTAWTSRQLQELSAVLKLISHSHPVFVAKYVWSRPPLLSWWPWMQHQLNLHCLHWVSSLWEGHWQADWIQILLTESKFTANPFSSYKVCNLDHSIHF